MRASIVLTGLISIMLGGCRTQPLGPDDTGSGGGTIGGGGGGGGGGSGGGTGIGPTGGVTIPDMAPYNPGDPDLGWPIDLAHPDLAMPVGLLPCGRFESRPTDPFALARWRMAAQWRGWAKSPWVAPYVVEIDFATDGTYYAATIDGSGNPPFYYDRNPERDTYHLVNLNSDGSADGQIYLEWLTAPDQLSNVVFSDNDTHLRFDYFHAGYGPVSYELDCLD